MTSSGYTRLTRKKSAWIGFSQVWLGSDHLLIVTSTRLTERYQRFAFSDIQAIVVSEGGKRAILQALVGVVCISAALEAQSIFARGFFGLIGAAALIWAIIDLARGPRCRCVLQTAVSRERLYSVSRMRTARAFLAAITPAIEAAQGGLPAVGSAQLEPAVAAPAASLPEPIQQPPTIHKPPSYALEILFGLLMVDSLLVFVSLRSAVSVAFGLLATVYVAEFLIGILALTQARSRKTLSLAVLAAALLWILIDPFFLSGTAAWPSFSAAMRSASNGVAQWDMPVGAPASTVLLSCGWRAAMALAGLAVCHFERTAEVS